MKTNIQQRKQHFNKTNKLMELYIYCRQYRITSIIISILFVAVCTTLACSKNFLDKNAQGALLPDALNTQKGLDALLIGAYAALDPTTVGAGGAAWEVSPSNWIYGSVAGGDSHKGSEIGDQPPIVPIATGNADPSNGFFNHKWIAMYGCIARANDLLIAISANTTVSDSIKNIYKAEARFLRAHFYFELKRFFNMVPFISDTTTNFKKSNNENIWLQIEADFLFAANNLPATQPSVGRVNKWAANSYLAKVYLYQQQYAKAKALFDLVIPSTYGGAGAGGATSNGLPYALANRFEDNFDAATKNGPESVLAIQMTANDGTNSTAHSNNGDVLNFPYNSPFRCCGFFQPSIDLGNSYRTDANGLPYVANYNQFPLAHDMGIRSDQSFTPDNGNLDPRIDWTIARRGLPVHDWGLHPGFNWVRRQSDGGPYANKKNLYWQATKATYSTAVSPQGSAINCIIIRFADVLLMAAECEAQLANYDKALQYVNAVRQRAALPVNMLYTYKDNGNPMGGFTNSPAANYKIAVYPAGYFTSANALPAIYFERKLELACEGHRFFDLVRWGIAAQSLNAYFAYEGPLVKDLSNAHFTNGKNEYFPIPQAQIDLSGGTLQQNPGY